MCLSLILKLQYGDCNFINKQTLVQVFFCEILKVFEKTCFKKALETWNCWVFLSFCQLSHCLFGLLVHLACIFVLLIKWLWWYEYISTLTQFVLMLVLDHNLVFFFEPMRLFKRKKKQENSCECFAFGFEETVIHCVLIKPSMQSPTHTQKMKSNLAILNKLLKWKGINCSYFRKLLQ